MICPKCKGLVLGDTFLNESCYWMHGLRCVNCGWVKWLSMERVGTNDSKIKNRKVNNIDELELYKIRSRGKLWKQRNYENCIRG